ncbi:TPA: hypothetical protein ACH3X3_008237 [Trebouxia sp. C0006]
MVEVTKKDAAWSWANQRELSFQQLKLALTAAPVVAIVDPSTPFELITDSSGYGLEPPAKARTEASTSADVTAESDVVSRSAAAYAADPIFADDNKTKYWNCLEDLWWDQEEIVVPDNQEVNKGENSKPKGKMQPNEQGNLWH